MPTYEYRCKSCGHRFDQCQSIKAKPKASCPKCRKEARRLISAGAGILFKGSGFYATDYRSSGYKKKAEAESSKKGKAGGCQGPCSTAKD